MLVMGCRPTACGRRCASSPPACGRGSRSSASPRASRRHAPAHDRGHRRGAARPPGRVLTGPNLAQEILAGHAAATVVAFSDDHIARELQRLRRPSGSGVHEPRRRRVRACAEERRRHRLGDGRRPRHRRQHPRRGHHPRPSCRGSGWRWGQARHVRRARGDGRLVATYVCARAATATSASSSARVARSPTSSPRCAWWPRASRRRASWSSWPRSTGSTCPSPTRSTA